MLKMLLMFSEIIQNCLALSRIAGFPH